MAHLGTKWTDDLVEKLKSLHADGLSCSQIAAEMTIGITRNAVIGKLHRLGLTNTRPRSQKTTVVNSTVIRKITRIVRANANSDKMRLIEGVETETAPLRCVEIEPRHLSLIELGSGDCRFPYGEGQVTFCGHPAHEGSYCGPHFDLTHTRPRVLSKAVQEQRRRNLRSQYKLTLMEAAE